MVLAQALVRLKRHTQAREALQPIGDGELLRSRNRLQLAQLHRIANDLPTARRILGDLLSDDEVRTEVQVELVNCDLQARDPAAAIGRLDGWIGEAPDDPTLYLHRGRVRLGLKREGKPAQPEQTEADLKAALDRGAEGVQAHMLLAQLYRETDRAEEAVAALRTAAKANPDDPRVPFQLGGLYERLGRTEEARAAYEDVLRLDQDRPIVKNNLAWLIADASEPSESPSSTGPCSSHRTRAKPCRTTPAWPTPWAG